MSGAPNIVAGIDPATRSCGVAVFDTESRSILHSGVIASTKTNYIERINDIVHDLQFEIGMCGTREVFIESFMMRGVAAEMLYKFIGATMYSLRHLPITEVRNTTVKRIVGATGKAEKAEVALGVLAYFMDNEEAAATITGHIDREEWDVTDAFAIAITGLIQREEEEPSGASIHK